uniref:Uncharacterized protein n=1 Tax=Arundo donax TaxID=35708 RepID=A0A0A9BY45_ARUDO
MVILSVPQQQSMKSVVS